MVVVEEVVVETLLTLLVTKSPLVILTSLISPLLALFSAILPGKPGETLVFFFFSESFLVGPLLMLFSFLTGPSLAGLVLSLNWDLFWPLLLSASTFLPVSPHQRLRTGFTFLTCNMSSSTKRGGRCCTHLSILSVTNLSGN